jgi:hypothetical protein
MKRKIKKAINGNAATHSNKIFPKAFMISSMSLNIFDHPQDKAKFTPLNPTAGHPPLQDHPNVGGTYWATKTLSL